MAGALGASTVAHLAAASHPDGALPPTVVAPAATVIMTVLVVVAWRVHVLIGHTPPAVPPVHAAATAGDVPPTTGNVPPRVPPVTATSGHRPGWRVRTRCRTRRRTP